MQAFYGVVLSRCQFQEQHGKNFKRAAMKSAENEGQQCSLAVNCVICLKECETWWLGSAKLYCGCVAIACCYHFVGKGVGAFVQDKLVDQISEFSG